VPLTPDPLIIAPVIVTVTSNTVPYSWTPAAGDSALTEHESRAAMLHWQSPGSLGRLARVSNDQQTPTLGARQPHTLHILGAGGDGSITMIDGAMLLAPLHLGGLIPQLSREMMGSASLRTGGAPAQFDGGTRHIMDFRTRAPEPGQMRVRGDVGMMSVDVAAEGSVTAHTSLFADVRNINSNVLDALSDPSFPYEYRDGIARADWRTGATRTLSLVVLGTDESIRVPRDLGQDRAAWGNRAAVLTWAPNEKAGVGVTASWSRGQAKLPLMTAPQGQLTARMDQGSLALSRTWALRTVTLGAGAELQRVTVTRTGRARDLTCTPFLPCSRAASSLASIYGDVATALNSFLVQAGMRVNATLDDVGYEMLPRVSIKYALAERTTVSVGAGRYSQIAVHEQSYDVAAHTAPIDLRRNHARQFEVSLEHGGRTVAFSGTGYVRDTDGYDGGRGPLVTGVDLSGATRLGQAVVSGGMSVRKDMRAPTDSLSSTWQRQAFLSVTRRAGNVALAASVLHGSNLPLTSIVLDGIAPPVPQPYEPKPYTPPDQRAQTRVDVGIEGSWKLGSGERTVHVAPYLRMIGAFQSTALFYYQQGGSADLRPLSALPAIPIVGVKWAF
jgi:hypothetical protein